MKVMSYYQHSNYFIGQGQVAPNQYQWSQPPYQQEFTGRGSVNFPATPVQEATPDSPIYTASPSTSDDEDMTNNHEPTLISTSVRIICPDEKKADHKTFMLRDVNIQKIRSMASFRAELCSQFGDACIDCDCEFGFFKGNKRIWVRTNYDLQELIQLLVKKATSTTLWCEGPPSKKRSRKNSSGSEEESHQTKKRKKRQNNEEKVDDTIDELREKHGHMYSNLQYRVWAEAVIGRHHSSLENPPRGSFFKRSMTQPSHDHSPVNSGGITPTALTPIQAAELKTTYISQIKALYSLFETGAISDEDFKKQKTSIMTLMDKL